MKEKETEGIVCNFSGRPSQVHENSFLRSCSVPTYCTQRDTTQYTQSPERALGIFFENTRRINISSTLVGYCAWVTDSQQSTRPLTVGGE